MFRVVLMVMTSVANAHAWYLLFSMTSVAPYWTTIVKLLYAVMAVFTAVSSFILLYSLLYLLCPDFFKFEVEEVKEGKWYISNRACFRVDRVRAPPPLCIFCRRFHQQKISIAVTDRELDRLLNRISQLDESLRNGENIINPDATVARRPVNVGPVERCQSCQTIFEAWSASDAPLISVTFS